jgi:hypothetical protein
LRKESLESGQEDVTEEEARELFNVMKDEYNEMIVMTPAELGLENHPDVVQRQIPSKPVRSEASNVQDSKDDGIETPSDFNEEGSVRDFVAPLPYEKSKPNSATTSVDIYLDTPMGSSIGAPSTVTYQQSDTMQEKFWSDIEEPSQPSYGPTTQTVTIDPSQGGYSSSQPVYESNSRNDILHDGVGNKLRHSLSLSHSHESTLDDSQNNESEKQEFEVFAANEAEEDYRLQRLRELLPTFSDRRLVKIIRCYQRSLGDPSLLDLIPIVRENMPDYITSTWLKQMSSLTANFVIQRAAEDEVINTEILNAVLEMQTSAGSLDRAIEFHQTEFAVHNLEPTEYSDRLVIQMLLRNSRFHRALGFKQTIESSGRSLDIKSYGSLIEFCSRRKQLGSAMLLLKECFSVHGARPGEASLCNLRLLCRQAGIEDEVGLESMIGKDPVEWIRHGERELKREYSKKGRRDVQLVRNMLVRL